jgi:hypothetical protein
MSKPLFAIMALSVLIGCNQLTNREFNSPSALGYSRSSVTRLPKVDDPNSVDSQLIAGAKTILDVSLCGHIERLSSYEAPLNGEYRKFSGILMTFLVSNKPIKGRWIGAGILLEDVVLNFDNGKYEYYYPYAVYRIYLQGTSIENSEWIAIRLIREHI